ncbi:hypothetical protein F4782DRAFT_288806 [Xylaria castorea]|nr:hypothetical protein F4782DRAFT_288806 [Xylaria castorea]
MANLPSQHPNLSLHLTDRALTPLITSARDSQHLSHLTNLTHTVQAAYESAQRLGFGPAQRIMVEHGEGPVLLQTFLSPIPPTSHSDRSTTPPTNGGGRGGRGRGRGSASRHSPSPHQGALALAVENRNNTATPQPSGGGGGGTTNPNPNPTTVANLRGGADNRALFLGADDPLDDDDDDEEENPDAPPMLFGVVVAAGADDTREARRAAARLERVGREIQGHWAELQQAQSQSPAPRARGRPDERQGDAAVD